MSKKKKEDELTSEEQTKLYQLKQGWLNSNDPDLQKKARELDDWPLEAKRISLVVEDAFRNLAKLISDFESDARDGTFSDYVMEVLNESERQVQAFLGTLKQKQAEVKNPKRSQIRKKRRSKRR